MCGWFQRGEDLRLAVKARKAIAIGDDVSREELQRDFAPQPRVAGLPDLAHAAAADQREDLIRANDAARYDFHSANYTDVRSVDRKSRALRFGV
jgi:hypothetical protein